jgi:hypothetical protein
MQPSEVVVPHLPAQLLAERIDGLNSTVNDIGLE